MAVSRSMVPRAVPRRPSNGAEAAQIACDRVQFILRELLTFRARFRDREIDGLRGGAEAVTDAIDHLAQDGARRGLVLRRGQHR